MKLDFDNMSIHNLLTWWIFMELDEIKVIESKHIKNATIRFERLNIQQIVQKLKKEYNNEVCQ